MITFIETEERNPTLDTLLRIADALEISLDKMIKDCRRAAEERNG